MVHAVVDIGLAEFELLDLPCTNDGILRDKVLWNMSGDDFDDLTRTHLRDTFTCTRRGAADAHLFKSMQVGLKPRFTKAVVRTYTLTDCQGSL